MSSYDEDFHQLLVLAVREQWEIKKIDTPDGLIEDNGRNIHVDLDEQDVTYLRREGYNIEGVGAYEFIAPKISSFFDDFEAVEPNPNIFTQDAQA